MSKEEDELECINAAAYAMAKQWNIRAEEASDILADHWHRVHKRTAVVATRQAFIIYIDALAIHLRDLFYSIVVDDEIYDEEMVFKTFIRVVQGINQGLFEANTDMQDLREAVDEKLSEILRNHTSTIKH